MLNIVLPKKQSYHSTREGRSRCTSTFATMNKLNRKLKYPPRRNSDLAMKATKEPTHEVARKARKRKRDDDVDDEPPKPPKRMFHSGYCVGCCGNEPLRLKKKVKISKASALVCREYGKKVDPRILWNEYDIHRMIRETYIFFFTQCRNARRSDLINILYNSWALCERAAVHGEKHWKVAFVDCCNNVLLCKTDRAVNDLCAFIGITHEHGTLMPLCLLDCNPPNIIL